MKVVAASFHIALGDGTVYVVFFAIASVECMMGIVPIVSKGLLFESYSFAAGSVQAGRRFAASLLDALLIFF